MTKNARKALGFLRGIILLWKNNSNVYLAEDRLSFMGHHQTLEYLLLFNSRDHKENVAVVLASINLLKHAR